MRRRRAGRLANWLLIAALTGAIAIADALTDFRVLWANWALAATACAALLALSWFYARFRETPDRRIAETLHETALLLAYGPPAAALSYVVLGAGLPLADPDLARLDRALGFDWPGWYRTLESAPALQRALSWFYHSSLAHMAILLIATGLTGRVERTRELNALLIATSLPIVLISGLVPAASAWIHHGVGLEKAYHIEVVTGLRDGSFRVLDATQMLGIITFPSFHTAIALVLAWVSRGIAWLFWPTALVNVGVLLSIPSEGGHYLVDMLAAAAITLAAIGAPSWLPRLRARHPMRGWPSGSRCVHPARYTSAS